ncbi:MAG TPA: hypothetical protein VGI39_35245 [Polyangiaceae bacterium]
MSTRHAPSTQDFPDAQAAPHAPQFAESDCRSVQSAAPPSGVHSEPVLHPGAQEPDVQIFAAPHGAPHVPQF